MSSIGQGQSGSRAAASNKNQDQTARLRFNERYAANFTDDEIAVHKRILKRITAREGSLAVVIRRGHGEDKVWILGSNRPGVCKAVWHSWDKFGRRFGQGIQCFTCDERWLIWAQNFPRHAIDNSFDAKGLFRTKDLLRALDRVIARGRKVPTHLQVTPWGEGCWLALLHTADDARYKRSLQSLIKRVPRFRITEESFEIDDLPEVYKQRLYAPEARESLLRHVKQFVAPRSYVCSFRPGDAMTHLFASRTVVAPHQGGVLCVSVRDSESCEELVKVWVVGSDAPGVGRCLWRAFRRLGHININAGDGVQHVTKDGREFVWSQHFKKSDIIKALDSDGSGKASPLLARRLRDELSAIVQKILKWEVKSLPNVDSPEVFYLTNGNPRNRRLEENDWTQVSEPLSLGTVAQPQFDQATSKVLDALGSARAREILLRILQSRTPLAANSLADSMQISPSAVSQHVKNLLDAGLIFRRQEKTGSGFVYHLEPEVLHLVLLAQTLNKINVRQVTG